MGIGASVEDSTGTSLFVDHEMRECTKNFITNKEARKEFAKFIKDGFWIDLLHQNKLLFARSSHAKSKTYHVSFASAGMLSMPVNDLALFSSSGSSRSSRSCSRETNVADLEGFSELYANVQDRTCFVHGDMVPFLFSVIFPLFMKNAKHADTPFCSRDEDDVDELEGVCTELGAEETVQMLRLQEILLGSAAFIDEADIWNSLTSAKWLDRLQWAIMDCSISICICSVERAPGSRGKAFHPVLVNHSAYKRSGSTMEHSDFLQLWAIEHDDLVRKEVTHSLEIAQPMRLISSQAAPKSTAVPVLDVTHIFDEHGTHRYVLGVLMDVPEEGTSVKHLQYLTDSALLISHLIKMPLSSGSQLFTLLKRGSSALIRQNSVR